MSDRGALIVESKLNYPGMIELPRATQLSQKLRPHGLQAMVYAISCEFDGSFGRRLPVVPPGADAEQIAWVNEQRRVMPGNVRSSIRTASLALGIRSFEGLLPPFTSVGFASQLQDIPIEDLVQVATGPGYWPDDNPTKPCLAVITQPGDGLNLLMPFADAPPIGLVALVQLPDKRFVVMKAMIMGTWRAMWGRREIVTLTLNKMADVAREAGANFSLRNVWAFVGPGASERFVFGGAGLYDFASTDPSTAGAFVVYNPGNDQTTLNLRGLAAHRVRQARLNGDRHVGIPEHQIGELAHDTTAIAGPYTSKRKVLDTQSAHQGPHTIPSNAMFLVVNQITN